jgi:hypothetical protein
VREAGDYILIVLGSGRQQVPRDRLERVELLV